MQYPPRYHVDEDPSSVLDIFEREGFASVIAAVNGSIEVTHAALVIRRDPAPLGRVQFHLQTENPIIAAALGGRELTVHALGQHAYVSPRWYQTGNLAPTWNYMAATGWGTARPLSRAETEKQLCALAARNESGPNPWSPKELTPERREAWIEMITGLEVTFTRLHARVKLSQEKQDADAEGAAHQFERRGYHTLAEAMRAARK